MRRDRPFAEAGGLPQASARGFPPVRRFDSTGSPARNGFLLLALALVLTVALRAADPKATVPPTVGAPVPEGPAALRQQHRVTVTTNAVTGVAGTNPVPAAATGFTFHSRWRGWDGLHTEVTRRLGTNDPFAEFREKLEGTNAVRVVRLEQLKLSGKLGAKLAVDGAAFVTSKELNGFDNGAELRRARLYGKGDCILLLPVSYELEIGYIPDEFYLEQSYLAFKPIPYVGEFKGGQFQAPMGLDMINSSRDLTFMEPAAPLQALAPGVNAGVQIGKPVLDRRASWRLGLFTDGVGHDFGDASGDYGRAIFRFTGLPWDHPGTNAFDGPGLLHVGVSANVLYSSSSSVRYQARPESHLAPHVVDTGNIDADGALATGVEAAWVRGPFSLQGEYLHSWVRENNGHVPEFHGAYVTASWFLTGESRPYDRSDGTFGRVIPRHDFAFREGGWGAWELAARLSHIDLVSGDVHGGRTSIFMAGVNWYLHSHVKWRFDYGFGHVDGRNPEGNFNIFETRVEVDF